MSRKLEIKTLILEYILKQSTQGHHPNSKEIGRYLKNSGIEVSLRTIQRRLEELQEEDWIDQRGKGTYLLDEEHNAQKMDARTKLERTLAYKSISSAHNHFHSEGYPIISFEAYDKFRGAENLKELLVAIKGNRVVQLQHVNIYRGNTITQRRVLPLYLKEYLNRWYVMCWDLDIDEERLFGIDRISNLVLLPESLHAKPYYSRTWNKFDAIVGLRYSDGPKMYEPMNLLIQCNEFQTHFLDSLPIHPSQEKIKGPKGSKNQTLYRYQVGDNFELEQRLLSMSSLIEVLEPAWYREKFKSKLKEMLEKY